jgi:hypothetical protein
MKKRRMMFLPEVNSKSFVLFFERGNSGVSWSIRDYSIRNCVRERGPHDFQRTADEIHEQAQFSFDAPTVSTTDLSFWHQQTDEFNQRYLGKAPQVPQSVVVPPVKLADSTRQPAPTNSPENIPILSLQKLLATSKGRKTADMERILHSRNSEDWVTWDFFEILLKQYPTGWWGHLVSAARRRNPKLDFSVDDRSLPVAKLWTAVPTPPEYEAQSRARMQASGNPEWVARAAALGPVEGCSEIDIALEHDKFLVFIEAKLGSDISMCTSHDPLRNQIVRNIDCLIQQAGERTPIFWLLARDGEPARAYVQLINAYKTDPGLLARELPHRSAETLVEIAHNLTILLWSDFAEMVCLPGSDAETNAVKEELRRRILG